MRQRKRTPKSGDRQRAVIFDFDGTIADSLAAVVMVFEDMTRGRHGHYTPEEVEGMREMSLGELLKAIRLPKWKVPLLMLRGRKMLREHLQDIAIHKGMLDAIRKLHEDGILLYVLSSNSTENVETYLKRHRLSGYFSGVYGGASLLGKAPQLLKLIDRAHIDVERSWYVGDETRDVSAARSVGLKVASVTWGYNNRIALERKEPDALVDTAPALVKTLERAWKK
jgi:phosphoglycolate phosphatase-like HAD superfamily hydrolase